jgi:hypothetical protein
VKLVVEVSLQDLETVEDVGFLEELLFHLVFEGKIAGQEIGEEFRTLDAEDGLSRLVGQVRAQFNQLSSGLSKVCDPGLPIFVLLAGQAALKLFEAGHQVAMLRHDFEDPDSFEGLDEEDDALLALADQFHDPREDSDVVDVGRTGRFDVPI